MGFLVQRSIQSGVPYIESVEGVAIVGEQSKVTIKGGNFRPESNIVCNVGMISNVTRSPNLITFDILATTPGSGMIAVSNGNDISTAWNSDYTPLLIARNPLNLTDGWLDFRTINTADLGVIISHINQGLATKTFANSGFIQDATKGLMIGATGTVSSFNNFIQFNSYLFPLNATKFEVIQIIDTTVISGGINYPNRCVVGIGELINFPFITFDAYNTNWYTQYRYNNIRLSTLLFAPDNSLAINNLYYLKIIFDFYNQTINIYKLDDLLNFDNDSIVTENIPIKFLIGTYIFPGEGIPVFRFLNPNSLSSVVAMKIT